MRPKELSMPGSLANDVTNKQEVEISMATISVDETSIPGPGEAIFSVHFKGLKSGQQEKIALFFSDLSKALRDGKLNAFEAAGLLGELCDSFKN